jgi:hypothetical protein
MQKFKSYLTEKAQAELSVDDTRKLLKKYIQTSVENSGIKIVGSSRPKGIVHIRFPIAGDPKGFFQAMKLSVSPFKENFIISSKYTAYVLTTTEAIDNIPKGTRIYWVNSEISQTTGGGQLFANKALSPDSLNLAGQTFGLAALKKVTKKQLKIKFPEGETAKQLSLLLDLADTKSGSISVTPEMKFDDKDFPKISADFGEILSAIWTMRSKNFAEVHFPSASNEKLIDFYGIKVGSKYPFSVKSGATGGKVTVTNIIRAIKQRAKTSNADNSHEIADEVFNMVAQFSMKEQMIMLHQKFKTPMIKELSKIMGMSVNSINVATIKDWCEKENTVKRDVYETKRKKKIKIESKGDQSKDNYLLTAKLAKWHKKWSQPEKKTLTGRDLPRFIISPLGQTIYPLLNNMPGMADSLTRIAQQVTLIQVNVNVKTKTLNFTSNFFKRADFKFSWAGYSGGNTLGFSMKMK